MAKGKKRKKGSGSRTVRAIETGAVAGAATYLAGAVVKAITNEAVERGADRLLKRTGGSKAQLAQAAQGTDLGTLLLRSLAEADGPIPVARLAASMETGLLPCLEAVQLLRRARMVKLGDGRRTVQLTPVGLEALELLSPSTELPAESEPEVEAEESSADSPPPPPVPSGTPSEDSADGNVD